MRWTVEDKLGNFKFWSQAADNAALLSDDQFDTVERYMEGDGTGEWTDTEINDLFAYDFDTICQWLGYKSDKHLEEGLSDKDVQDMDDWAYFMDDGERMLALMDKGRRDYIDEDGELDEYELSKAFQDWWDELDDFKKKEIYDNNKEEE